jgi:hypothetical protein
VEAMPSHQRDLLGAYWCHRARSELRVAHAFRIIQEELTHVGASPIVIEMLAESIDDEHRHSELCRRLAERYGGAKVDIGDVASPDLPTFEGASRALRAALRVTAMCCINETIATVWLKACFERSRAPLARAANHLHLREEMKHARLGWAHLASPSVTPQIKASIAARLPSLLRANVPLWYRDEEPHLQGTDFEDHGILSTAQTKTVVLAAVDDVVLPGFREVSVTTDTTRQT